MDTIIGSSTTNQSLFKTSGKDTHKSWKEKCRLENHNQNIHYTGIIKGVSKKLITLGKLEQQIYIRYMPM